LINPAPTHGPVGVFPWEICRLFARVKQWRRTERGESRAYRHAAVRRGYRRHTGACGRPERVAGRLTGGWTEATHQNSSWSCPPRRGGVKPRVEHQDATLRVGIRA
jgi:hypothetical protein